MSIHLASHSPPPSATTFSSLSWRSDSSMPFMAPIAGRAGPRVLVKIRCALRQRPQSHQELGGGRHARLAARAFVVPCRHRIFIPKYWHYDKLVHFREAIRRRGELLRRAGREGCPGTGGPVHTGAQCGRAQRCTHGRGARERTFRMSGSSPCSRHGRDPHGSSALPQTARGTCRRRNSAPSAVGRSALESGRSRQAWICGRTSCETRAMRGAGGFA